MRTKRLYRAVAYYLARTDSAGTMEEVPITRHFQTKKARDNWAKHRAEGYPEQGSTADIFDEGIPAIEPALRVEKSRSKPIEWEEGER